MPIETTKGGITITGKGIDLYRLIALRSALRLEMAGMKVRRGFSALKLAKETTGLKTNDRRQQYDAISAMVDELSPKVVRVVEVPPVLPGD